MTDKVWILTREINDYNQDGAYFEAAFATQPSIEQLVAYFGYNKTASKCYDVMGALSFILHVQNGGGRQGTEHEWYNLEEVTLL